MDLARLGDWALGIVVAKRLFFVCGCAGSVF